MPFFNMTLARIQLRTVGSSSIVHFAHILILLTERLERLERLATLKISVKRV